MLLSISSVSRLSSIGPPHVLRNMTGWTTTYVYRGFIASIVQGCSFYTVPRSERSDHASEGFLSVSWYTIYGATTT